MIDFHTHILPNVDDGSKGVEESALMLTRLFEQGVNKVIATPHFYANDESVDEFLLRRNAAFEKLSKNGCDVSKIILGAEVRYYDGISHLQDLKKLRIEGTRFLLLEMPFNKWTDYAINEVIDIANRGKISLVLAHIDRYLPIISKSVIAKLSANGVLFQANSSFFDSFFKALKAIKMLKENKIHFIGSDSHNMSDRSPNMNYAINVIKKKLGNDSLVEYIVFSNNLFEQNIIEK
jgi:protein-tyrosine phosphatase